MKDNITANFGMTAMTGLVFGASSGYFALHVSHWLFTITITVISITLTLLVTTKLINETLKLVNNRMGIISKKEANDLVTYIDHTVTGKNNKSYYFVPTNDASKALEIAHTFQTPTAQRFEKWTIKDRVVKGQEIWIVETKFIVPKDGFLLVFNKGSAW